MRTRIRPPPASGQPPALPHGGAYSPDHACEFGLERVLDGLGVLIQRRGHAG